MMNPEDLADVAERTFWKIVYYGSIAMAILCTGGVALDVIVTSAEVSALGLNMGQIATTVIRELATNPLDLTMTAVVGASALANHHASGMLNTLNRANQ